MGPQDGEAVTPTNSAGSGELSSGDLEGCDGVLRVRLRLPSSRPRGYRKLGGAPGGAGKRRRCDVARRRTGGAPGRIAANSKGLAKSPRSTVREGSRTRKELLLAALHSGEKGVVVLCLLYSTYNQRRYVSAGSIAKQSLTPRRWPIASLWCTAPHGPLRYRRPRRDSRSSEHDSGTPCPSLRPRRTR